MYDVQLVLTHQFIFIHFTPNISSSCGLLMALFYIYIFKVLWFTYAIQNSSLVINKLLDNNFINYEQLILTFISIVQFLLFIKNYLQLLFSN